MIKRVYKDMHKIFIKFFIYIYIYDKRPLSKQRKKEDMEQFI